MGALETALGGPEPNDVYMAEWLRDAEKVRVKFNEKTGDYEYFLANGWWPGADVRLALSPEALGEQALSMVSPLLKVFLRYFSTITCFSVGHIRISRPKKAGIQVQEVRGFPLEPRIEHLARQLRVINEPDRILQTIDRQGWEDGVWRSIFGKSYPQNYERQKRWWEYYQRQQLREAKRQRTIAEKKGETGNVQVLDKTIQDLETYIKEWQ